MQKGWGCWGDSLLRPHPSVSPSAERSPRPSPTCAPPGEPRWCAGLVCSPVMNCGVRLTCITRGALPSPHRNLLWGQTVLHAGLWAWLSAVTKQRLDRRRARTRGTPEALGCFSRPRACSSLAPCTTHHHPVTGSISEDPGPSLGSAKVPSHAKDPQSLLQSQPLPPDTVSQQSGSRSTPLITAARLRWGHRAIPQAQRREKCSHWEGVTSS